MKEPLPVVTSLFCSTFNVFKVELLKLGKSVKVFLSRLMEFTDTSPPKTFVCSELIALPDKTSISEQSVHWDPLNWCMKFCNFVNRESPRPKNAGIFEMELYCIFSSFKVSTTWYKLGIIVKAFLFSMRVRKFVKFLNASGSTNSIPFPARFNVPRR